MREARWGLLRRECELSDCMMNVTHSHDKGVPSKLWGRDPCKQEAQRLSGSLRIERVRALGVSALLSSSSSRPGIVAGQS